MSADRSTLPTGTTVATCSIRTPVLSRAVRVPFWFLSCFPSSEGWMPMLDATLPIVKDLVRDSARPLTGSGRDYDSLLEFVGDARFVLLGEASHGTHEFYSQRAQVTKRLIQAKAATSIGV